MFLFLWFISLLVCVYMFWYDWEGGSGSHPTNAELPIYTTDKE